MFSPLPLRLWCMAAMAPALTEAATQARAKLPTTGVNGRQAGHDGTTSPAESAADTLAPPRSSVQTSGSAAGKPKAQLVTLSKGLVTIQSSPVVPAARLASSDIKTSSGGLIATSSGTSSRPSGQTLVNGKGRGVVNLTGGIAKFQVGSRQNGSVASSGHSPNLITNPSRMNPPKITLPQTSQTPTTPGGIVMMPHSAAVPSIQSKTSAMGFTSKTSGQISATNQSQSQGSTSSSPVTDVSGGGVAGSRGQSLSAPTEPETVTLPQMGDLATVTNLDMQIVAGMGMSDVGLLSNVDLVEETSKRQKEHERRSERLLRRLRRLQSRQSIAHVQEQLSGFVDHQHKNLQTMAKAMKPQPASSVDLKAELLQSEDVKSLSTAALVSLVRKLQTSQALTLRQRLANASQTTSEGGTSVLRLDEDLCTEMNRVSSTLQMDLKHLEKAIDSDATESSSGGESCDEDYDYDDDKLPKAYLRRRAEWKWATDRSAVASRWTWLQAQVSDLEYRIRQQSDIYRQIRAGKGAVVLGEPASQEELLARLRNNRQGRRLSPLEEKIANLERKNEMSPCNLSTLLSNVDKQSSKLTQQLGNVYSPSDSPLLQNKPNQSTTPKTPGTPNGYVDLSGAHSKNAATPCAGLSNAIDGQSSTKRIRTDVPLALTFDPPSPAVDNSCQAARCRPVRSYGKRKLLRTSGLHQLNRKAARLSTVRCHCFPPVTPCAMCGGRFNNTQTLNPTVMPMAERIAMLDPSCHQVLSFPQDTPLPIHFEALLKNGEWQHKPLPYKPIRSVTTEKRGPKVASMNDHTRKYKKQLSKNASSVLLSSAKIRNKYEQKQHSRTHGTSPNMSVVPDTSSLVHSAELKQLRKRKGAIHAIGANDSMRKKRTMSAASAASPAPSGSQSRDTPSPLSVSCPSSTLRDLKEAQRRRRGESAFDINNIVIPYSMAAATRVEKLLYKEIITPKWREIPQVMQDSATPSKNSALDDPSASLPTPTTTPEQGMEAGPPEVTSGEKAKASVPTPLHNTTVSTPSATSSTSQDNTTSSTSQNNTTSPTSQENSTISTSEETTTSTSQDSTTSSPSQDKATSSTSQATPSTSQATPLTSQATPSTSQATPSTSQDVSPSSSSHDQTPLVSQDTPTSPKLEDIKPSLSSGLLPKDTEGVTKDSAQTLSTEKISNDETPKREGASVSAEEDSRANNSKEHENKATSLDKVPVVPSSGESSESQDKTSQDAPSSTSKEGEGGTMKVPAPGGNGLILPRTLPVDEKKDEEDDEEVEDLSDELYAERHARCEISEKKRFTSVVKKRSRGARADSTGPLGDPEPTPEHLDPAMLATATPPGTPVMAPPVQLTALVDEELELCGRRRSGSCSSHEEIGSGRRRSHSAGKMRNRGMLMSTSMHEDQLEEDCGIEPWGTRTFPLGDEEYETLFKDIPPSEQIVTRGVNRHSSTTTRGGYTYSTATPENSNPTSPVPSSSNSSIIDDDPNDPEWTVVAAGEKPVPQPGLVLKLAKR